MTIFKELEYFIKRIKRVSKLENQVRKKQIERKKSSFRNQFQFHTVSNPKISMVVYGNSNETVVTQTLFSIAENIDQKVSYEIIVTPSEPVQKIKSNISGLKIVQSVNAASKIEMINDALRMAEGEFVLILKDSVQITPNFIEGLLSVFQNELSAAVVSPKVSNFHDENIEAGGFLNAKAQFLKTTGKTFFPSVNYCTETDSCSATASLFKKSTLTENNFLDTGFESVAYALADLSFRIKKTSGFKTYYTPFSEVIETQKMAKNHSSKDQDLFSQKWQSVLGQSKALKREERILELHNGLSVVIFSENVPAFDKDAGSNRLKEIIYALKEVGFQVILLTRNTYLKNNYIAYYQKIGVNVFYEHTKIGGMETYLKQMNLKNSLVWFYNPIVFNRYYQLATNSISNGTLLYDMIDIHHLRYQRNLELDPNNAKLKKEFDYFKRIELEAAQKADIIIPISDTEKKYMEDYCDVQKMITISNVHYIQIDKNKTLPFEERKDILFIGSTHTPNVDALYFLYQEILPLVWKKIPEIKVNIIGNISELVTDIKHPHVIFHGYVPQIEDFFISNKLMIAPLRYGAGVKGKVGQAFEYYLPVVTTSIGAEGMKLIDGENALITNDPVIFAEYICTLYTNKELWLKLQDNSEKSLEPFSRKRLLEIIGSFKNRMISLGKGA